MRFHYRDHPRFTEHKHDQDTSLNYIEGRFQLADKAKFNRPDPQRDWDWLRPHTLNLYEYCANDPVNMWDPTGFADQSERSADEEIDESIWKRFTKWLIEALSETKDQNKKNEARVKALTNKQADGSITPHEEMELIKLKSINNGVIEASTQVGGVLISAAIWEAGGAVLAKTVYIIRGSRLFKLKQGNAKSGWKHIFDRHVDIDRFIKKSKFPESWTTSDILEVMGKTIKHGDETVYEGKTIFTYKTNFKNSGYKKYRATIDADNSIQTFHQLED